MGRTQIPINTIHPAGIDDPTPTGGDHTNGMYLPSNNGRVTLRAKNTSGGLLALTVKSALVVDGLPLVDLVVDVTAGNTKWIGGLNTQAFNQTDGTVNIDLTSDSWELTAFTSQLS